MKTKIAKAGQMKVHPAEAGLVTGNRDMEANAITSTPKGVLERHRGMKSLPEF